MSNMKFLRGSLSVFPDDTFPRYNYAKDRVKPLLARFEHLGFKTTSLPSDNETSIMELRRVGSTLQFCISSWTEHDLSDSTDKIQVSDPKPVIFISDNKMDLPQDCMYGVILDMGQLIKRDNEEENVISSSIKELQANVDLLLQRYVLSFLKDLSEKVFKVNGDKTTKRLLSDVMAVYHRSCAPRQEWPGLADKETPVIDESVAGELFKCDEFIKGFGYQHDVLQIFVDRQYHEKSLGCVAIRDFLNRHNITEYHINYGPWTETPLCDIKVGNELAVAERRGTLGGFALKDDHLYALTSRHLLDDAEDHNTGASNQGHGTTVQKQLNLSK